MAPIIYVAARWRPSPEKIGWDGVFVDFRTILQVDRGTPCVAIKNCA